MKTLLIAAGAVALMSGAAYAQTTPPEDQTIPPAASPDMAAPPAANPTDMPSAPAVNDPSMAAPSMATPAPATETPYTAATTTTMASNTGVNVQTVTNGPVPDTPENRAKYGQPMSHAGKRSAPVGN
jgi:hypothetical protein